MSEAAQQHYVRKPSRQRHSFLNRSPPFPLMRRIAITAYMSKLAIPFLSSKGFVMASTAADLLEMCARRRGRAPSQCMRKLVTLRPRLTHL